MNSGQQLWQLVAVVVLCGAVMVAARKGSCRYKCHTDYQERFLCQCDVSCYINGDCCDDIDHYCGICYGKCGSEKLIEYEKGKMCSCDKTCEQDNTCCKGFDQTCKTCQRHCTYSAKMPCQCDPLCENNGDCCNDATKFCKDDWQAKKDLPSN